MATTYPLLISAEQLQALLQQAPSSVMVFDCSAELTDPQAGALQFASGHIPGAVHVDAETQLSTHDMARAVNGGRHPLPRREDVAAWLGSVGFRNDMQAVVYDRQGSMFAGRLWWMLKWLGHDHVAVLDGGWPVWQALDGARATGMDAGVRPATVFKLHPPLRTLVTQSEVAERLDQPDRQTLIDARAEPRFRGDVEPLDPVAGHIPGALNRPGTANFEADGRFKPAATLRAAFDTLLAGRAPATVVHQCGSGISATANLLAMELAGYGPQALYAGSWSEWCRTEGAPVARGPASA